LHSVSDPVAKPTFERVLFDLPPRRGKQPGCGGDLRALNLSQVISRERSQGDVYVIKKVVHDWDDSRATAILRNCRKAMSPNGKVLVAETLVPPGDEPNQIKGIDVVMLAVTGGLERTEAQYKNLFDASGLRLERVIQTRGPISILEASPING